MQQKISSNFEQTKQELVKLDKNWGAMCLNKYQDQVKLTSLEEAQKKFQRKLAEIEKFTSEQIIRVKPESSKASNFDLVTKPYPQDYQTTTNQSGESVQTPTKEEIKVELK